MNLSDIIKEVLSPEPYIQFAYLFGSMAKGKVHPLSDYDIGVFIDQKTSPSYTYGIRSHITTLFAGKIPTQKIQVVILNQASPLLAYEVINNGILVLKKNDLIHHNFVFRTYQRYIDLKRFYERQQNALIKRVKTGTYGE